MSETQETTVNVKVDAGSSGFLGAILAFFFGPLGMFFSCWLVGKWSFLKSFFVAFLFVVCLVLSGLLCYVIIGFVLVPIVYIVMLIVTYKACSNQNVSIKMPSVETTTTQSTREQ
ncbi:hypothetical protein LS71_006530 [Helicobacter jaachi]|uniref:Uncharacterized protein n=1 Tax=Helicobacter jaachi TaxID=1677920 RepID=A0A4U8T9N6_9HELI|nr:hypothetical protein [Helicobacter jaachi]TLD96373.1 hypothetical protein LS71_006530 [Helicobacter jaachi]